MKQIIGNTTVLLSTCFLFTGCLFDTPNAKYAVYHKNVKLIARSAESKNFDRYAIFIVGDERQSFSDNVDDYPDVMVKLSKDGFVRFGDLNVEMLEKNSYEIQPQDTGNWPDGTRRLYVNQKILFIVNGNRILRMHSSVFGPETDVDEAVFKKYSSKEEFILPFTHKEMIELLGEPGRIGESRHW